MTDPELQAELNQFIEQGHIKSWSRINGRWVINYYDWWNESDASVPFTKPQVIAFISGISCGMGWVKKVAAEVGRGTSRDEVFAAVRET